KLRQETGDTYETEALLSGERTASWMAIQASYDADKAVNGLATVIEAIREIRDGRVSEADVAVARETQLAAWRTQMATAAGAASRYGTAIANGEGLESVRDFPARLAKIGRDDVVRSAARYLTDGALHVVIMGED